MADSNPVVTCPKCESAMRTYERSGVTLDQCTGCRGIYLDRGELDRLIDAETGYYAQGSPSREIKQDAHGYERGHGHGGKGRKRGGFLSELFD